MKNEELSQARELKKESLKQNVRITHEADNFQFRAMSVAYHFAEIDPDNGAIDLQGDRCEILGSFEFDLFLYRFQEKPPYRSFCLTGSNKIPCTVGFPESVIYTSEGRNVQLNRTRPGVEFDIAIHCTFFNNGSRIWTLVFSPATGTLISQDEVIKAINLFCLSQEQKDLSGKTNFETSNYKGTSFTAMAKCLANEVTSANVNLFNSKLSEFMLINSGIVQIEVLNIPESKNDVSNWRVVIELIDRISKKEANAFGQMEDSYKNDAGIREILNLICGFSLGIFDYTRMSFDEVIDTLLPISSNRDSVLLLNKGILASVSSQEDPGSTIRSAIGINPYLLISSAVLAFDDYESASAENLLDHTLDEVTDKEKSTPGLEELIHVRKKLQRIVNEEILTNVFHYPTERITLEHGLSHRGINDRIQNIRNRLNELNSVIYDQIERDNKRNKIIVALLLAAISILGMEAFFGRIYSSIQNYGGFAGMWEKEGIKWIVFFPVSVILFSLIAYFTTRDLKKRG